ncbi:MAG: NAD(P)/FAD-dependent oxidoreductase [Thermoplasmataceae archaeon]
MDDQYDVIIVGGAAAGLTAALYASRQALKTLVITKDIGGQALLTNEIGNYPGFESISGFDLMSKIKKQCELYGTVFLYDEVRKINYAEESCFEIVTTNNRFITCALIMAFGKTPRDLGVLGEEELKAKGVSYCAICDGPLFKGKDVAVVGLGDPALEAAQMLSDLARKVTVVLRGKSPIGDEETINNLKERDNVEFLIHRAVKEIKGSGKLEKIFTVDLENRNAPPEELKVSGLFIEMGYVTKTEFLKGIVNMNGLGEIITNKDGSTSMPGIFAAGDVTDVAYKQAVISAGQGAIAALSAYNYLQALKGKPHMKSDWKKVRVGKEENTEKSQFFLG